MDNHLNDIKTYYKNVALNPVGAEAELEALLSAAEVDRAVDMMQDRDNEVDKALAEYNVQTHKVMNRRDKRRRGQPDYNTEKLPRNRQRYINEVELFFLLGNPIEWVKDSWDDDEAYDVFSSFLSEIHFNARMRQAKRLAGAETESAKLYRVYRQGGEIRCDVVVLARSTGYLLRPLFDQYGNMLAFACGYQLKEQGKNVRHWDFYTERDIWESRRTTSGWEMERRPNPLGKIPVIYFRQLKAWDGAVARIEREEMLDSKTADTNNYFADPIAKATADVIQSLAGPEETGKMIQMSSPASTFEYINPPQSSQTRVSEKADLERSILFDTMTPDLSFEAMRGLGGVSGVAIRNAMTLGYIKRENYLEIYEEMVQREKSLIVEILKMRHPDMAERLHTLKDGLEFRFSEPFARDDRESKETLMRLYSSGLLSLEEAVHLLGVASRPDDEAARIREEQELRAMAAQAQAQMAAEQQGQGEAQAPEPEGEDLNPATANLV